jgi:glutaredoxin 3
MLKVVAVPILVLLLLLTYTIHSQDISTREIHEHSHEIMIYSKTKCPYCIKATEFLDKKKVNYREIDVTWDDVQIQKLIDKTGAHTVPYVFVDGNYIGGYSDLVKFVDSGGLK